MKKTLTILAILFLAGCTKEKQCESTFTIKGTQIGYCLYVNQQKISCEQNVSIDLPSGKYLIETRRYSGQGYFQGFIDSFQLEPCKETVVFR
jgi:hypothetical protein